MKKYLKPVAVAFGIIFFVIQFFQPERENPFTDPTKTMVTSLSIPDEVQTLFERGCYDCHSNNTQWPFYSYIAPASWLISYDVKEGRKHFNMSEWESYKFSKKVKILGGIVSTIKEKEMPLPKYIPLHPAANLSDAERDIIIRWAKSEAEKMMNDQ